MKGLRGYVYRNALGDGTNSGASNLFDSFVVVSSFPMELGYAESPVDVDEVFESSEYLPEMIIVIKTHSFGNMYRAYLKEDYLSGKSFMFGGNYIASSDSRFPGDSPIKIFDRYEGK